MGSSTKNWVVGSFFGIFLASKAFATPTLQVYVQGSVAQDQTSPFVDQDTWVAASGSGAEVDLDLMGYFGNGFTEIDNGYLSISVPQGQTLSLQWSYPAGSIALTSINAATLAGWKYASNEVFESTLESVSGVSGAFNNHAPYGTNSVVDVYGVPLDSLLAGLGVFHNQPDTVVPDCNATAAGTTSCAAGSPNYHGEIKTVGLLLGGVDWAHFDLVAQVTDQNGTKWLVNPGSHDSSWRVQVPEPPTYWLFGVGALVIAFTKRRRSANR